MQFGIFLPAHIEMWRAFQRAEGAGFSHGWLYDSQMLFADVFSALTLAAEHTDSMILGPGVTNPGSRVAPLMASSMGTINAIAPGRAVLGIGSGNTTRRAMGLPPVLVEDFRDYLRVCRALMAGERVDYHEGARTREIELMDAGDEMFRLDEPIPVIVSAFGPKTYALAGELGDGVMIGGQPDAESIARVRAGLEEGAHAAGRDPDALEMVLYTSIYVLEEGEGLDSQRLRDVLVPLAAPGVARWAVEGEDETAMPEAYRGPAAKYRDLHGKIARTTRHLDIYRGYLWRASPALDALVTEDLLRSTVLIGTADEVLTRIREWEALGVTQIGLRAGGGIDTVGEFAERFGAQVISRYE
jgi:alkanesulfonate monooxygenase SsuD/methylene tetrahydromethanopterin reductase-like flavin-dependent oxidoreductase (luciferase family)